MLHLDPTPPLWTMYEAPKMEKVLFGMGVALMKRLDKIEGLII